MTKRRTHGMSDTKIYAVWGAIKKRCTNKRDPSYKNYGERGISMCDEWSNSFMSFYGYVGKSPGVGYSLDRIDNDGNYEPGNVRWATRGEQNRNSRRNRMITFNGNTMCMAESARLAGMHPSALRSRLRMGWSAKDALTLPVGAQVRKNDGRFASKRSPDSEQ